MGCRVVGRVERRRELEELPVRRDPVGKSHESRYQVVELRLVGQRLVSGAESSAKPSTRHLVHEERFLAPAIEGSLLPGSGRGIGRERDRPAMMSENRPEQRLRRIAPLHDLPNRRVERVVVPAGEYEKAAALVDVSKQRAAP